ncbi:hypothetical protein FACS189449_03980 [Alphaproteobacteria bacterium]|nr:hypothetical protein FACS189449_03980 [Alphaproteobacteria bacterium]
MKEIVLFLFALSGCLSFKGFAMNGHDMVETTGHKKAIFEKLKGANN